MTNNTTIAALEITVNIISHQEGDQQGHKVIRSEVEGIVHSIGQQDIS